jgi:hypothetical protein
MTPRGAYRIAVFAALALAGVQACNGSTTPRSVGSSGAGGFAGADAGGTEAGGAGGIGTGDAGASGGAGGGAGSEGAECGMTRCGMGQVCVVETVGEAIGHFCKANPCGTHTLSCTCAGWLCLTNESCSITPPSSVNCTCQTCV